MSNQEPITVEGIWLIRDGEYAVVKVERDGKWIEIIREHVDGPFSHICEPNGVRARENGIHAVPIAKPVGWGRGMFIAGAAAGVTPNRKSKRPPVLPQFEICTAASRLR